MQAVGEQKRQFGKAVGVALGHKATHEVLSELSVKFLMQAEQVWSEAQLIQYSM